MRETNLNYTRRDKKSSMVKALPMKSINVNYESQGPENQKTGPLKAMRFKSGPISSL